MTSQTAIRCKRNLNRAITGEEIEKFVEELLHCSKPSLRQFYRMTEFYQTFKERAIA